MSLSPSRRIGISFPSSWRDARVVGSRAKFLVPLYNSRTMLFVGPSGKERPAFETVFFF